MRGIPFRLLKRITSIAILTVWIMIFFIAPSRSSEKGQVANHDLSRDYKNLDDQNFISHFTPEIGHVGKINQENSGNSPSGLSTIQNLSEEEGDETHHHADSSQLTPIIYLFYWGILILVMVIILIYFIVRFKRGHKKPMITLAFFLIVFIIAIYLIELLPIFSGRFDPASSKIIYDFHETNGLGFLRFMYKFLLGIFLTLFAFFNMDTKRFKSAQGTKKGNKFFKINRIKR